MQAVASFYVLAILAALVAAPTRARALLAVALVTGAAAAPWFLPRSWVFFRTAYGIAAFVAVAGVLDVVRRRRTWTAAARVLRVLFFFDLESARRTHRHLDIPLTIVTMLYQALGLTALWVVVVLAPEAHGAAHWVYRWGGGAVARWSVTSVRRSYAPR